MKSNNHTKKIVFLAFLLSLLFHFSGIIFITIRPYLTNPTQDKSQDPQAQPEPQNKINKQQQSNEWVETKARVGNFGTPVFFEDEFESSYLEASENKPEQSELQQEEPKNNKSEIVKNKPEEPEKEQEMIPQFTSLATQNPQPIQQKKIPPKTSPQKTFSQNTQNRPLAAPKPPLTLAQLSQGFLNHVKHEGNHAIHMLGKKSGRPTDEQIKYERYLQKLSWCLQNSFNIHYNRFPASATGKDDAHVLLALNKDGSLKHCHISKTSGNRDLDYFITFIFKDASTSFPPVPEYLPHDPFAINYIIMVSNSEESRWQLYRQ